MNLFEELDTLDPSSKLVPPRIETPTPHKIAVLILLKQYVRYKRISVDTGITMRPHQRRMFCMLIFKLIQEADMTYNELHYLITTRPYKLDTLLLEPFEKAMSEFCGTSSIEALFDFAEMQNIDSTLLNEDLGVSRFIMVGVYVRRIWVVLERFTFGEMMCMYKNICAYYERGIRVMAVGPRKPVAGGVLHRSDSPPAVENIAAEAASAEAAKKDLNKEDNEADRNSVSKWAPKQAKYFINQQSDLLDQDESNALPPKELQRKVQEIIQDLPLNTASYFLGYMNQLRVRDYYNALSALHRALDRSPVRLMSQEKGYQYFSINLAVLHATFGHRDEALAALRESIVLAQEHGDKRSLNLANTWYCLLRDEVPLSYVQRSAADIADADGNLLQNYTLALHYAVKLGTMAGYQPLRLFDLLQHSDNLTNRNNLANHASEALALRSAVWCAYGRNELSALYAQLLLSVQERFNSNSSSAGMGSALASYALWLQLQGELRLARVLLHRAREYLPRMPNAECWMISQCHVIIQSGIYRCRWHDALKACDQLYLLDQAGAMQQRASIYVAKGEFYNARRLLDNLASKPQLPFLLRMRVKVLLAYCSLAKGHFASEAVMLLLGASEDMSGSQMDYELALVDMLLAQLLLMLGMPQKAYQAIKRSMVDIHINGGLYERARADFVFVRCLLAIAEGETRKAQLMKSLDILERAAKSFKQLSAHAKVLDVYVYLAHCFHDFGERASRNKYSGEFRRYFTAHPIPREYLNRP